MTSEHIDYCQNKQDIDIDYLDNVPKQAKVEEIRKFLKEELRDLKIFKNKAGAPLSGRIEKAMTLEQYFGGAEKNFIIYMDKE